jgi:hypothetical protein
MWNDRIINELWIGKDVEGSGLIWGWPNMPVYAWRDLGVWRKASISKADILGDIWTPDLPNTKQECLSTRLRGSEMLVKNVASPMYRGQCLYCHYDGAVSRRLPTAAARVRAQARSCGICGGQIVHWGRFSPSTSVCPTFSHSTVCSSLIIFYHSGLVQQPISGQRTKWTRLTPPQKLKKKT